MKVVRASACSPSLDARETRAFYYIVCVLLAVSASDEKPSQIVEKSTKNRSWTVLGVKSRFGDPSGRVRDATGTRQSRPRVDLGTPRARQERPGGAQATPGRSQDAPERVRSDVGARAARKAPSGSSSQRFFIVFVLSRESSDVLFALVFTAFC